MQKCWVADNRKRPSFTELRATFDAMLSNAQNATYIDLNVDEMLPYYSMNAAEQGEDGEVTEEDLHPTLVVVGGDDDDNKGGYPDTKGLRNSALLRSIEKLEEGDDDSSIASADVAVLDSAGEATAGVKQHEVVRCKGEGEGEERGGDQHSTWTKKDWHFVDYGFYKSHKFFLICSLCKYALSQLYTDMYSMNHFFIQFHYGHMYTSSFFSDKLVQAHRMKLLY